MLEFSAHFPASLTHSFHTYDESVSNTKSINVSISYKSIDTMIYRYRHPELKTGKKRGRPKETNLTKEDWKERYEIVKKYQDS